LNHGYRRITTASERDRQDVFTSAARRVGITEQNVEKDFWVCWTLNALFHGRRENAPRLLFKGGTSLSKAFGLIRRFSEDIDITVFRQDLGEPISIDDLEQLSGKKRGAKLDEIRAACQQYLKQDLRRGARAPAVRGDRRAEQERRSDFG
jgi:predicted nucleotidyltransferase component of viral defense system